MERVIKSQGTKTFRSKKCERQIQYWNITALLWRHAIGSVLRPWSFRLLGVSNFSTPMFSPIYVLTWKIQNEDSLATVFYWPESFWLGLWFRWLATLWSFRLLVFLDIVFYLLAGPGNLRDGNFTRKIGSLNCTASRPPFFLWLAGLFFLLVAGFSTPIFSLIGRLVFYCLRK
jgi:hypothetical protein